MNQEVEPIETSARRSLALLIQQQGADLTRLITEGEFPLADQPPARFNLIPGWRKALQRVDELYAEAGAIAKRGNASLNRKSIGDQR